MSDVHSMNTTIDLSPIGQRVIILPKVVDKVGTIIIPENTREMELTEGTVIALGPDCIMVNQGDIVYYGRYSGFKFERNGHIYRGMNEEDILFIVNSKEDSNE